MNERWMMQGKMQGCEAQNETMQFIFTVILISIQGDHRFKHEMQQETTLPCYQRKKGY